MMFTQGQKLNAKLAYAPGAPSGEAMATKYRRSDVLRVPDASELGSTNVQRTSDSLTKQDYVRPEASKEIKMLPMEKPTECLSIYRASFADFKREGDEVREVANNKLEAAQTVFEQLDIRGEGFLLHAELPTALWRVLGHEATERQQKAFKAYFAGAPEGRIGLLEWLESFAPVADYLQADSEAAFPAHVQNSVTIASRYRERQDEARRTGILPVTEGGGSSDSENVAAGSPMRTTGSKTGAASLQSPLFPASSRDLAVSVRMPVPGSPSFGMGGTGVHAAGNTTPIRPLGSIGSKSESFGATAAASATRAALSKLTNTAALASSIAGSLDQSFERQGEDSSAAAPAPSPSRGHHHGHGEEESPGHKSPKKGFTLHGPQPSSSYRYDVGAGNNGGPASRPAMDPIGSGLFTTTHDLLMGTTRMSKHIPGTAIHIPSTTFGHAGALGLGQTAKDSFNSKTNLAETFNTRLPGYGGHAPKMSATPTPEARIIKGQFAPTEPLRADHLIDSYWEARQANATAAGGMTSPARASPGRSKQH